MIIGLDGNEANVKNRVGSGTYALALLKEFQKNKKHQFSVFLKVNPLNDLPQETANFQYKVFGPQKLWTRFALPLILLIGKKPDIFFSMGHYGPSFSAVPYVVTIFDLSYLHYPELFKKNDLYQLINWSKHSINNSKHIFAISESTKEDIVKNYKIDPSKISVTHMGYDNKTFKPQSAPTIDKVKTKYKIKGDYIIFVGTLQPRKNVERLIEAFASIVHSSQSTVQGKEKTVNRQPLTDNLSLVIAGKKGWFYDEIFQKIKDLGLESNIILTGYVSGEELPALISGAKAYILPSLWEGFGIPVIEAQACGVPVIVANTSSLPEVVGNSGITVNPADPKSIADGIRKVLTNNKLSRELVHKGHANVKRFSWQKCAQETLRRLESLSR